MSLFSPAEFFPEVIFVVVVCLWDPLKFCFLHIFFFNS